MLNRYTCEITILRSPCLRAARGAEGRLGNRVTPPLISQVIPCRSTQLPNGSGTMLLVAIKNPLTTWTDRAVFRSRKAAFRDLRSMRHDPPGSMAKQGERRQTFTTALEQAQQQITAAASVDYESRPLNLFYGLSQAGRAIAAVSGRHDSYSEQELSSFSPRIAGRVAAVKPWELSGHGIQVQNLDQVTPATFPQMALIRKRDSEGIVGSFARLLDILVDVAGGSRFVASSQMEDLWATLLEAGQSKPLTETPTTVLTLSAWRLVDGQKFGGLLHQRYPILAGNGQKLTFSQARSFLDKYPTIANYELIESEPDGEPVWRPSGFSEDDHVRTLTNLIWPGHPVNDHEWQQIEAQMTTDYRGRPVVLPELNTGAGILHPLMAWWAVLYALSMLCRYRPAVWTQLIDINKSEYASAIEHLLEEALDAVPDIIERTIRQVAA